MRQAASSPRRGRTPTRTRRVPGQVPAESAVAGEAQNSLPSASEKGIRRRPASTWLRGATSTNRSVRNGLTSSPEKSA